MGYEYILFHGFAVGHYHGLRVISPMVFVVVLMIACVLVAADNSYER